MKKIIKNMNKSKLNKKTIFIFVTLWDAISVLSIFNLCLSCIKRKVFFRTENIVKPRNSGFQRTNKFWLCYCQYGILNETTWRDHNITLVFCRFPSLLSTVWWHLPVPSFFALRKPMLCVTWSGEASVLPAILPPLPMDGASEDPLPAEKNTVSWGF